MDKPGSIIRFERFWFASTFFWLLGTGLAWDRTQRVLEANPQTIAVSSSAQWVVVGLVLATTATFWYLVVRRASAAAKWLVVALAVLGAGRVLLTLFTLATSANPSPLPQGAFILAGALTVASAVMLFRDDARGWFGEDLGEEELVD